MNELSGKEPKKQISFDDSVSKSEIPPEEKKELAQLRKDRDSRDKENEENNQTISALKQQVTDLEARLVAAINTQEEKPEPTKTDPLKNPLSQRT